MHPRRHIPVLGIALVFSFLLAWLLVARHFQLPIFASQKSALLLQVGAVDGAAMARGEWWRLLTSQFLHVHFMHMLFNSCAIFVLGAAIERRAGLLALALVYLIGGSVGQFASVLLHPELVSSGASQAMLALCGFLLIAFRRFSMPLHVIATAAIIVAIQFVLDLYVSGAIKPGHSFGFAAGLVMALVAVAALGRPLQQRLASPAP